MKTYHFRSSYSGDGKVTASYQCVADGDDAAFKIIGRFNTSKGADEACINRAQKIKKLLQNINLRHVTFLFDLQTLNSKNFEKEFNTP